MHDIDGLLRVHRFLFATDAEREQLIADVVAERIGTGADASGGFALAQRLAEAADAVGAVDPQPDEHDDPDHNQIPAMYGASSIGCGGTGTIDL